MLVTKIDAARRQPSHRVKSQREGYRWPASRS